jgi:hypothetical protein
LNFTCPEDLLAAADLKNKPSALPLQQLKSELAIIPQFSPYLSQRRASALYAEFQPPQIGVGAYIISIPVQSLCRYRNPEIEQRSNPRSNNLHLGTAATTHQLGSFFDPCHYLVRSKPEQGLKQANQTFAVGMQKAEISGASKPFWQYMTSCLRSCVGG